MARASRKFDDHDEYISRSTIDTPPREPLELSAGANEDDEGLEDAGDAIVETARPSEFSITLELKIKSGVGTNSIPILKGKAPGNRIEEMISLSMAGDYFLDRLRAVVGYPLEN